MKITAQTGKLLIIDDRPWLVAFGLGAMLLAFVGAGIAQVLDGSFTGWIFLLAVPPFLAVFLFVFVRRTQLVINGQDGWVEIRERSFLGYSAVRHRIDEIECAVVETMRGSEGGDSHRVALIIPEGQSAGRHPLTEVYTSGNGAERAADAVNRWLDSYRARA